MNFKYQLFHSKPLFSGNNISKFGDNITLENILFVNKSINRQVSPIIYNWFTFSGNLHRYETCWSVNDHLNISIFRPKSMIALYSRYSIQNILMKNLSLKNSTPQNISLVNMLLKSTNRNILTRKTANLSITI